MAQKIQVSENEMVKFVTENIAFVPKRSEEVFKTYDLRKQYNKMRWYVKNAKQKEEGKNLNICVVRVKRMFEGKNASVEDVKSVMDFCTQYLEEMKQKQLTDIEREIERLTNLKNEWSK